MAAAPPSAMRAPAQPLPRKPRSAYAAWAFQHRNDEETTEELWGREAELEFRIEERLEQRWLELPQSKRAKLERRATRKLAQWRGDMARLGTIPLCPAPPPPPSPLQPPASPPLALPPPLMPRPAFDCREPPWWNDPEKNPDPSPSRLPI